MTNDEKARLAADLFTALNPLMIACFLLGLIFGVLFFSGLFRFLDRFLESLMPSEINYVSDFGEKKTLYRFKRNYYSKEASTARFEQFKKIR